MAHVVGVRPGAVSDEDQNRGEYESLSLYSSSDFTYRAKAAYREILRTVDGLRPLHTRVSRLNAAWVTPSAAGSLLPRSSGASSASGSTQEIWTSPSACGRPWVSFLLCLKVSEMVASISVLHVSGDEKPLVPLRVWIAGYAAYCLASLPVLYWRYVRQYDFASYVHHSLLPAHESDEYPRLLAADHQSTESSGSRFVMALGRFDIALHCFVLVWFVVGNFWIFGGEISSSDLAPNLYWWCTVLLVLDWFGYGLTLVICVGCVCCLSTWRRDIADHYGVNFEVKSTLY